MSKHRILCGVTFLIILFFSSSILSFSAQERRTALVIGNGSYESAPLRNPVNDASDIAAALRKLGFTTIHKQNATQKEIEDVIREFGKNLRKGGVGLFYYAGHGLQVNGINYIIPLDAKIFEETDVKYEAVDARRVLDAMYNAGNNFNIVILDACRDNPLVRGFRSGSNGLARMDAPKGTIVAYSTSPGKVALDGEGRNSPYTAALLEYMDDPGLTIEQVFKKCRRRIDKATNGRQIPWESTSLTGDFYFSTKGNPKSLREEQARLERERKEFEMLKAEFERRQRERQRQRIEVTSLPKASEYSPTSGEPLPASGALTESLPKKIEGSTPSSTSDKAQHTRISVEFENKPPETPSRPIEVASLPKTPEYPPPSGTPLPAWGTLSKNLPKKTKDSPKPSTSDKVVHDGIYTAYANGIVKDTSTGLEWKVGPARWYTWHEAKSWVESLNLDGDDWKMPTVDELQSLYKKGIGIGNMTPLLKTPGGWVWSRETEGSSKARGFNFHRGSAWGTRYLSYYGRAFAVRSRSNG